jgi:hypothetical protein
MCTYGCKYSRNNDWDRIPVKDVWFLTGKWGIKADRTLSQEFFAGK